LTPQASCRLVQLVEVRVAAREDDQGLQAQMDAWHAARSESCVRVPW